MVKIGQNNKQISVVWIKSVYYSVDLAFGNKMKQCISICNQLQKNNCINNHWMFLDLVCRRQTFANFTGKTFAVYIHC